MKEKRLSQIGAVSLFYQRMKEMQFELATPVYDEVVRSQFLIEVRDILNKKLREEEAAYAISAES